MKRSWMIGLGATGVALVALPATVLAADFPPPPPTTYYGKVTGGAQAGQGVIAVVTDGTGSTVCGAGLVDLSSSDIVYVVDVAADAQKTGCGKSGRSVQFYFTPTAATGGRLAVGSLAWEEAGPRPHDLALGTPLTKRAAAPSSARDGIY
jgi:hypothetical protein